MPLLVTVLQLPVLLEILDQIYWTILIQTVFGATEMETILINCVPPILVTWYSVQRLYITVVIITHPVQLISI